MRSNIITEVGRFHAACRMVLTCPKANEYAKAYAQAGLSMSSMDYIKVQALYILSNLSGWRGENAKVVKQIMKETGE